MEDIRYAVIHANNGRMFGWPFDTMEEADLKAEDLNSIYGDGLFVSRAIDKREAELKKAESFQILARDHHKMALYHMECAADFGDAWALDRDDHLERARGWQHARAKYARCAMEMMGIIDPD